MTAPIRGREGSRKANATPPARPIRVMPLWQAPLPGREVV